MWEAFKKFFENQSALANFLQIVGAVGAVMLSGWRVSRWVSKRIQINRLSTVSLWLDRKSTRLNSSHVSLSRMPSSA